MGANGPCGMANLDLRGIMVGRKKANATLAAGAQALWEIYPRNYFKLMDH